MRSVILVLALLMSTSEPANAGPFERRQRAYERVDKAFEAHLDEVERQFADAGAAWPPREIYLRAFKLEGMLELWAAPDGAEAGAPRVLVRSFPVCQASGVLGPKRREGDRQVPEGFYRVDRFNPRSSYHLSLGIDYPNAVDRARAGDDPPGSDIFIHGDCVTIGCLPLQDEPMEALYVVAVRARDRGQRRIPVHIFPCRFGTDACHEAVAAADEELGELWGVLAAAHGEFELTRVPPRFEATRKGYRHL